MNVNPNPQGRAPVKTFKDAATQTMAEHQPITGGFVAYAPVSVSALRAHGPAGRAAPYPMRQRTAPPHMGQELPWMFENPWYPPNGWWPPQPYFPGYYSSVPMITRNR